MANPAKEKPSFLSLPGELKNHIYRLAGVQQGRVLLRKGVRLYDDGQKRCYFSVGRPDLALTCREMYHNVRSIYYTENSFYFTDEVLTPGAITTFERLCGPFVGKIISIRIAQFHLSAKATRFGVHLTQRGVTIDVLSGCLKSTRPQELLDNDRVCSSNVLDIAKSYHNCLAPHQRILVKAAKLRNPLFAYIEAFVAHSFECQPQLTQDEFSRDMRGYERRQCDECRKVYFVRVNGERRG